MGAVDGFGVFVGISVGFIFVGGSVRAVVGSDVDCLAVGVIVDGDNVGALDGFLDGVAVIELGDVGDFVGTGVGEFVAHI